MHSEMVRMSYVLLNITRIEEKNKTRTLLLELLQRKKGREPITYLGGFSCQKDSSPATLPLGRNRGARSEQEHRENSVWRKLARQEAKAPEGKEMKRTWTSEELLEHFTLLPDEVNAVGNKSGATRLGFAVLFKCFQYEGRFLRSRQEAAPEVVRFLATQVGVDFALFVQYAWEGRTIEAHRSQIRALMKVREFRRADEEALLTWLCTDILPHEHHPERLRELIRAECRTREIEVPDDITALIETGFASYETQIYAVVLARLTPEMQSRLDALLVSAPATEGEEEEELPLNLLRLDPGPVGVESALSEIAKLRSLRAIGLPVDLFQGYTPKLVERLRRRIAAESPSHIRQHPQAIRLTLLAALVVQRTQEVTDALITLLIQIVHRIGKRAERRVEAAYITDLKRVAGKTRMLYKIADAALEHPDESVRDVVFPVVNEQTLRDLVAEYKAQGGAYRQKVQEVMRASYRHHYRQILPALLEVLDFHSNNTAYQPVIEALAVVREYVSSRVAWYPLEVSPPLEGVIPDSWENIVTEKDSAGETRVNRLTYELSVLQTLRERVRSKEIWVAGAAQFRNYVEYADHTIFGLTLKPLNPCSCKLSIESANAGSSGSSMERQHAPILMM
jgi:Domain of unknown function (DUF4158)